MQISAEPLNIGALNLAVSSKASRTDAGRRRYTAKTHGLDTMRADTGISKASRFQLGDPAILVAAATDATGINRRR
jgi:hypothetical protein